MPSLACPYCYERFDSRQIEFRCTGRPGQAGKKCELKRDERLFQLRGLVVPLPPTFEADARRGTAKCPDCEGATTRHVCPICHSQLPVYFGKVPSRLVAMVGARESGKTVFMTVLLHELATRVGARFNAAVDGCDDDTRGRFASDYEDILYNSGRLFGPTQGAAAQRGGSVSPLVFRFTTEKRSRFVNRPSHTLLSFFDTAGEDLTSQDKANLNARYLGSSDGVVVVIDPLQLPGARSTADIDAKLPQQGPGLESPFNVLSRVTELLRERLMIGPEDRIHLPMAVAVSKLDALWHNFDEDGPLRRLPSERPAFDTNDSLDVHAHIQALIHEWGGGQVDSLLQLSYDKYRYFGFSALGETPTRDNRVADRGIRPYRVAEPLLWILSELGAVPVTKGSR
ncbi:MAG: hypothetical protein LC808_24250 [Actinobacteria bacterium]|nr:hypothetical protein [Actinomycetota bacterium]